ncbi:hypothetical protein D7V86_07645 [bacterium D16-51]|nr:hypothetical protein D7V96_09980 [bacterium D16-59]RKI60946.1 hypothetical protein D7V86_07645 [bacterium D16-51]
MSENTRTQMQSVSYETVAEAFSEEAKSLISDSAIQETLGTEKIRFENASLLGLPAEKLTGHNTARCCKDLLRQKQPLPFVYFFLCFITEISVWLVPYGIIIEICHYINTKNNAPLAFPTLYGLFLIIGLVAANTLCRQHLLKILGRPIPPQEKPVSDAKKAIARFRFLVYAAAITFVVLAGFSAALLEWDKLFTLRLPACFIAYVACILLSGVHNVLYSSHFLSFFTVGILILSRRPEAEIKTAAKQYLTLRYLQMLTPSHKSLKDLEANAPLEKKMQESLHSHMITQRIYDIFALIILFTLDAVCISQFRTAASPAFACFFALAFLLTCVLLLALISANYILKYTNQPTR